VVGTSYALHANNSIQLNLFCVHLILRGCDPSDMELVNTEIRLQISYMMYDTIQLISGCIKIGNILIVM